MLRIKDQPVSIMVLYCIALHLWWAAIILIDVSAIGATPVDALFRMFDNVAVLVLVLVLASALAIWATFLQVPWAAALCLAPQQFLLMMSAAGALSAIYLSQFADGVVRPRAFIAADQLHIVLAAAGHTMAIIAHALSGET